MIADTPDARSDTPLTGPVRRIRWLELLLVLGVCFGTDILYSANILITDPFLKHSHPDRKAFTLLTEILVEVAQLALLAYVLFRQGRRFRDIGLNFRWTDILVAVPLYGVAFWARRFVQDFASHALGQKPYHAGYWHAVKYGWDFDIGISSAYLVATVALALINPFAEELIVRAYMITEVRILTGKTAVAVIASTLFAASYHFYQGVLPAIGQMALFFVFSLYYARTGRIMPVVLAHMAADLLQVV